jgi:tetratricopeptide (TPR) repeat protein
VGARARRRAEIAPDLELIVAKAMHKDATRRYATAEAFGDDLQRYVEGRPVLAHPDSAAYRLRKFLARHRTASAIAAVALAALLAAAGVAWQQAQRAARAADDTAQVNAFLIDVLNVSSPYASGSELTLGEALDAASAKVDERFADRPDLSVVIRTALGESQVSRYRLEAAESQLLLAIRDGERAFGRDDARVVHALSTLGNVRKEQGRDDEARALFEDALARLQRSGGTGTPMHAEALNDLGVLMLVTEKPALALPYLEQAAAIDVGPDRSSREEHARTLANLAQAARGVGDLERADRLYREAQPALEALYPEGGPHLAVILNNRARLAWARGQRDDALALQRQAVAMHQRSFAGDHVMIVVPMTNLARMALDHGEVELASEWADQAAAMAERLYADSPHPYHVNALAAVVAIGLQQGRVADVAAPAARMKQVLARLTDPPASTRSFATGLLERLCETPEAAPEACG